jgi:adenylate kinase
MVSDTYKGIVFFGPPGVGKGIEANRLASEGGYYHFSSGNIFRNLNPDTDIGAEVKKLIDGGNLVPDELTLRIFDEEIAMRIRHIQFNPNAQILILDGLPRTIPQIPYIEDRVNVIHVLYLDAPEDILLGRMQRRAAKKNRADDQNPEINKHRLEIYKKMTLPILDEYKRINPNLVKYIDGSKSVEATHLAVRKILSGN